MDPRRFPNLHDPDCLHSVGLYKSGRCKLCGFKVTGSMNKRMGKRWVKMVFTLLRAECSR